MWTIQLTITINFISSEDDNDEECVMHSKIDDIAVMISDEAVTIIEELFDSLKTRYQSNVELIRGSEFDFDYVILLYYKYKINSNGGLSYIDSPDWINKIATINPINKKDKCF